jgi:hypothetical protein
VGIDRGSILPLKMIFPGFLDGIIKIGSFQSSHKAVISERP